MPGIRSHWPDQCLKAKETPQLQHLAVPSDQGERPRPKNTNTVAALLRDIPVRMAVCCHLSLIAAVGLLPPTTELPLGKFLTFSSLRITCGIPLHVQESQTAMGFSVVVFLL